MPELPEVEFSRRLVQKSLAKKRISAVKVANDKIVCQVPAGRLKALKGRTVKQCRRWGKQLWFEMDKGPSPMFHLGMTGSFHVKGRNSLKYVRLKEDDPKTWPPKFWKVEFQMSDGTCFAMSDPRRFGRIGLSTSVWEEPCMAKMGFDPLLQMPRVEDFARQLARRSGDIKAVLLDQSFAAGVGNWVADEVLYQAAVHPQDVAKNLSPNAVKALHRTLRQVVKKACQVNADAKKFPRTWLFHYRWGKGTKSTDGKGREIRFLTSGGRTSAYVPSVQRPTGDLGDLPGDSGRNEEKRQSDETIFK
ncbi:unnamed protein product [Durusdinium trenchii]|uniref:Formamidopyrimidine-DNA glycosylase catalytic domain-containing protein n=1 Tax=Durusdinium trenchii TaxID=1381693 RepID=A0ABP0HXH6_9DINO